MFNNEADVVKSQKLCFRGKPVLPDLIASCPYDVRAILIILVEMVAVIPLLGTSLQNLLDDLPTDKQVFAESLEPRPGCKARPRQLHHRY